MTHAIDTVFLDAILIPLLRELGLPETLPLAKFSPHMQKWVLGEPRACDGTRCPTRHSLCWLSAATR
jgi:hypothetical protein